MEYKLTFKQPYISVIVKNDKLYYFSTSFIIVFWGNPIRASVKSKEDNRWRHIRPYVNIKIGIIDMPEQNSRIYDDPKRVSKPKEATILNILNEKNTEVLPWEEFTKSFENIDHYIDDKEAKHIRKILKYERARTIVEYFKGILDPEIYDFISKFNVRQFHLISLFSRCPEVKRFIFSNDNALIFMLANLWVFYKVKKPFRTIRSMLIRKDKKYILKKLGYPNTNQMVKILRKIPIRSISINHLLTLRGLCKDKHIIKILSQLKRINRGVISILKDQNLRERVNLNFLHDVSENKKADFKPGIHFIISDIIRMEQFLGINRRTVIHSVHELNYIHDDLIEDMRYSEEGQELIDFDIPFPESEDGYITPIKNSHELRVEGRQQRNCVGSYVNDVKLKHRFVYSVKKYDRCTFSIKKNLNDIWVLEQIFAKANSKASTKTIKYVNKWLYTIQGLKRDVFDEDQNLFMDYE